MIEVGIERLVPERITRKDRAALGLVLPTLSDAFDTSAFTAAEALALPTIRHGTSVAVHGARRSRSGSSCADASASSWIRWRSNPSGRKDINSCCACEVLELSGTSGEVKAA